VEEHLLICPECQSALDAIDEYKIFMKAGLASFEKERQAGSALGSALILETKPDPAARRMKIPEAFLRHLMMPRMPMIEHFLAAALLFVIIGAAVAWRMQSPVLKAPIATVKLIALRGGEGFVARAPLERPLDLVFDRSDLLADVSYHAEVVNSSGRRMWTGRVQIDDRNFSIRLEQLLPAGEYWIRLYSSAGELLREFGLNVG
jgi:hypothetical protein